MEGGGGGPLIVSQRNGYAFTSVRAYSLIASLPHSPYTHNTREHKSNRVDCARRWPPERWWWIVIKQQQQQQLKQLSTTNQFSNQVLLLLLLLLLIFKLEINESLIYIQDWRASSQHWTCPPFSYFVSSNPNDKLWQYAIIDVGLD